MVKHLIEATLRSRKIKRKRYADGGGDLSDADQAAMMPETYVNPVAKGLVSGIGHMAMIPQRAIENSQNSLDTGNYDPGPTLEAAMLPMGTGAIAGVPLRAGESALGAGPIRAYHGSPHDFDVFDSSKIGTGEGTQAYGRGLYFGENPQVAETYKQANLKGLTGTENTAAAAWRFYGGDSSKAIDALEAREQLAPDVGHQKAADLLKSGWKPKGRMYEVDINADSEHFLDWDKPLSEQSPAVLQKLDQAGHLSELRSINALQDPRTNVQDLVSSLQRGYQENSPMRSEAEVTAMLHDAGIPGIKYLDQGSRGAGEGSRNYVVFNDKLIDIRKKKSAGGIVTKAGGGALSFDDLPNAAPSTGGISFDDLPSAGPSVGADVAKSAGVGAGKGLIDFAGTAGDAGNLLAKGSKAAGDYIGGLMGFEPSPELHAPVLPTSGGIQKAIESKTGQFYQPQTTAGKFAGAITESAANPLSYVGPGGMAGKVAGAVATGAGSEGAGELAQKYAPEAEPYARIAGGLLGGAAAGTASAAVENTMRARGIPTTQDLHNAADAAYGNARALNVEYSPGQLAILRDQIHRDLLRKGFRADKSAGTFNRINELPDPPTPAFPNGNRNFSDIEGVRQTLREITGEVDTRGMRTADAKAADRAIDRIDDFLEDPSKAVAGHQGLAAQQAIFAREGRENWGAMARSQQVEAALARGQRNADASGTGSNVDNTLRQQVKQILNNPRRAKNFTNDDRQIMEDIVAGNPIRNSARLISKLAATGIVSATGVVALGHMMGLGGAGVAALPAIGEGARRLGVAMTRNRYQRLLQNIRMDSAVGRANPVGPRASAGPSVIRSALTTPRLYVSPGSNPYAP